MYFVAHPWTLCLTANCRYFDLYHFGIVHGINIREWLDLDYVKYILHHLEDQKLIPIFDEGIRSFLRIELIELVIFRHLDGGRDLLQLLIDRVMTEVPRVRIVLGGAAGMWIDHHVAQRQVEDANALYMDSFMTVKRLQILRDRLRTVSCPLDEEMIGDLEAVGIKIDPSSRKQTVWNRVKKCLTKDKRLPVLELQELGNLYHSACYILMIRTTDFRVALTRLLVYDTHTRWDVERMRELSRSTSMLGVDGSQEFRMRTHKTTFNMGRAEQRLHHARSVMGNLARLRTGRLSDLDVLITP